MNIGLIIAWLLTLIFCQLRFVHVDSRKTNRNGKYGYQNSEEILDAISNLAELFPDLVTLESAQDIYGMPVAGKESDCPYDPRRMRPNTRGCKNWILTIEDKIVHPKGSESYERLPEVFLSGAINGDERVGPTVIVELASLLLEAASCESLPQGDRPSLKRSIWEDKLTEARYCREQLSSRGINDSDRKWLARLVTTRRIVMIPTANALGYFRNEHTENGIDPEYDFPFDIEDSTKCMQTIAGRVINEVFRDHVFQLAISFHSGHNAIAYEWGGPSFLKKLSPDNKVQQQIASGYSAFGGIDSSSNYYQTGTINDIIEPKRGNMVDWAYAGSWFIDNYDSSYEPCVPETYGGYSDLQTFYEPSQLRVLNMRIDVGESSNPPKSYLGSNNDVLNQNNKGLIPRNLRISLMMLDIVEPYLTITAVNGVLIQDDVVPLTPRLSRSCIKTKIVSVPLDSEFVSIDWEAGGGFNVDSTTLLYAKWDDLPLEFDGFMQPPPYTVEVLNADSVFRTTTSMEGHTRWYTSDSNSANVGPNFAASIDVDDFEEGDIIAVFATSQFDSSWTDNDQTPQSHLVNTRTTEDWYHVNAGKVIQGNKLWFSVPLTLIMGPPQSSTFEVSGRLPIHDKDNILSELFINLFFVKAILFFSFLSLGIYFCRKRILHQRCKEITHPFADDELEGFELGDGFELSFSDYSQNIK